MEGKEEKLDFSEVAPCGPSSFPSSTEDRTESGPNSLANMDQGPAAGKFSLLEPEFLPFPGEPTLKWNTWFQMFEDHLVCQGFERTSDARKLAFLGSNLGSEGYRICSEVCKGADSFHDTVAKLEARFAPKATQICLRSHFFSSSQQQSDASQTLETRNETDDCRFRNSSPSPSLFGSNSKSRNSSINRRQFQAHATEGPRNMCANCANRFHMQMQTCPAKGKKCNSCGKRGHFAKCCRSSSNKQKLQEHASSISPIYSLQNRRLVNTIESETDSGFKFVSCAVNGKQITLLVDLGVKVSILNLAFINSLQPRPVFSRSTVSLTAYGGSQIPQLGTVQLSVHYASQHIASFSFQIVRFGQALMGIDLFDALGFRIQEPNSHAPDPSGEFGVNSTVRTLGSFPHTGACTATPSVEVITPIHAT